MLYFHIIICTLPRLCWLLILPPSRLQPQLKLGVEGISPFHHLDFQLKHWKNQNTIWLTHLYWQWNQGANLIPQQLHLNSGFSLTMSLQALLKVLNKSRYTARGSPLLSQVSSLIQEVTAKIHISYTLYKHHKKCWQELGENQITASKNRQWNWNKKLREENDWREQNLHQFRVLSPFLPKSEAEEVLVPGNQWFKESDCNSGGVLHHLTTALSVVSSVFTQSQGLKNTRIFSC